MKFVVLNKDDIAKDIADKIVSLIKTKERPVLGLATGSTPLPLYEELIKRYKKGEVSFKNVKTFNLDEYIGLDELNDQSYRYFMNHNLFNHIDIDLNNTYVPNGLIKDEDPSYYDKMIKEAGGIDIQVLGIGTDGHIAFNEPGASFDSLTHIEALKESTIKDNSRFFASIDDVPRYAITMGLKSIMNAREIVLIATGKAKAKVISELKKGIISNDLPASILNKHNNVTIYVDEEANSL